MTIKLRPYQLEMIRQTREAATRHRRICIQSATGSGKTVVAAAIAASAATKGHRVSFLCHRSELLTQTDGTFQKAGLSPSFVASNRAYDPSRPVQICSIQSMPGRIADLPAPEILLIDEAHHVTAKSWQAVCSNWPKALCIGLTATPERLSGAGLGEFFDKLILGPSIPQLIDQAYLSNFVCYSHPQSVDLSGITTQHGDYNQKQLAERTQSRALLGDIVQHHSRLARGKKTIAFAVNTAHSKAIAEAFQAAGVPAAHVDGDTKPEERAALLRAFARGEILVLTNCELFSEGFDLAANAGMDVNVEAVICARPTQSIVLHLQQVGRALRPKPEPAIILDHAGNCARLGLPDQDREWSLDSVPRLTQESVEPRTRRCDACGALSPVGSAKCSGCGQEHVSPLALPMPLDGQLEVLNPSTEQIASISHLPPRVREEVACETREELIELGTKRGYRNPAGWAYHKLRTRKVRRPNDEISQAS